MQRLFHDISTHAINKFSLELYLTPPMVKLKCIITKCCKTELWNNFNIKQYQKVSLFPSSEQHFMSWLHSTEEGGEWGLAELFLLLFIYGRHLREGVATNWSRKGCDLLLNLPNLAYYILNKNICAIHPQHLENKTIGHWSGPSTALCSPQRILIVAVALFKICN